MSDAPDDPHGPSDEIDSDDDLRESAYDTTGERRFLSGRLLVGVGAVALLLVAAGVAFAVSGGGSEPASGAGDDGDGDLALQEAALEYAGCMREEGLENWPDPVVDEEGDADWDRFTQDHEQCQAESCMVDEGGGD